MILGTVNRRRFDKHFVVFDEAYKDIDDKFINEMFAKEEASNPEFANEFYNRKMDAPIF